MIMSRPLALATLLVFSACDATQVEDVADFTFEATVQTSEETRVLKGTAGLDDRTGEAVVTSSEGLTITGLLLAADDAPDTIRLVSLTRGPLTPGVYDVSLIATPAGQGGETGPFLVLYDVDGVVDPNGLVTNEGFGQSGEVEIFDVSDGQITGRFEATLLGGPAGPGTTTEVEGTFTVEIQTTPVP